MAPGGSPAGRSPPPRRAAPSTLSGDELVPLANHVAVLVHQGVPAGHLAHPFPEGAAVALLTGLFHQGPVRVLDVALGVLAVVPEAPLVLGHEFPSRLGDRTVVPLLGDEPPLPARLIPVQVLVGGIELDPGEMAHR